MAADGGARHFGKRAFFSSTTGGLQLNFPKHVRAFPNTQLLNRVFNANLKALEFFRSCLHNCFPNRDMRLPSRIKSNPTCQDHDMLTINLKPLAPRPLIQIRNGARHDNPLQNVSMNLRGKPATTCAVRHKSKQQSQSLCSIKNQLHAQGLTWEKCDFRPKQNHLYNINAFEPFHYRRASRANALRALVPARCFSNLY